MATGSFQVNDPRGEYWLYTEGDLLVNVGRGGIDGVCHVNTSDVHLHAGGPLHADKVADILGQLLAFMGSERGGYSKLALHNDGQYTLTHSHFAIIDNHLRPLGFQLVSNQHDRELMWAKDED